MRKIFLAAAVVAALIGGSPAFAQGQQVGYLGQNPGGHQAASAAAPTAQGSGQGGYLGLNHGANLEPARVVEGDMKASPTNWCRKSPEPSRCRGRANDDHQICAGQEGDS